MEGHRGRKNRGGPRGGFRGRGRSSRGGHWGNHHAYGCHGPYGGGRGAFGGHFDQHGHDFGGGHFEEYHHGPFGGYPRGGGHRGGHHRHQGHYDHEYGEEGMFDGGDGGYFCTPFGPPPPGGYDEYGGMEYGEYGGNSYHGGSRKHYRHGGEATGMEYGNPSGGGPNRQSGVRHGSSYVDDDRYENNNNNNVNNNNNTSRRMRGGKKGSPTGHGSKKGNANGGANGGVPQYAHGLSVEESVALDEDLRAKLTRQLANETYECLVCCDAVKTADSIFPCGECFAVFHLRCIKRWAATSINQEDNGWRCPACSKSSAVVPSEYRCFCGKVKNPRFGYHAEQPHACGQICKRKERGGCPHKCVLSCHPGPCPSCPKHVDQKCNCGSTVVKVRCGAGEAVQCDKVCGKGLPCGVHECSVVCHTGSCRSCQEEVKQLCYCGSEGRKVQCTPETATSDQYGCDKTCGKTLSCGEHKCALKCHAGDCGKCERDPEVMKHCPCGQTKLEEGSRKSCLDAIPTCDNICNKELICGPEADPHRCKDTCHEGPCPPCDGTSPRMCRCGSNIIEIPCGELVKYFDQPIKCDRRCNKKRSCRVHKCGEVCCTLREHICMQVCDRLLNCGLHRCDHLCHAGRCQPCLQASFQELYCECGAEVLHPPVACGAKAPPCTNPCTRNHPCGHPVSHPCHSEANCPPCAYLTEKWCYGEHEKRRNIPCHLSEISCGLPCGYPLPCGHKCTKPCHKHLPADVKCKSLCTVVRNCGHPCNERCHAGEECPGSSCKTMVSISCPCGSQNRQVTCFEATTLWDRAKKTKLMASQVESTSGQVQLLRASSVEKYVTLQCTPECDQLERNRRLAEALDLSDVDHGSTPAPTYTDFLREQMTKNQAYVMGVEKALVDLVQKAKGSTVPKRSHPFPSTHRDNRRIIHEYGEYFKVDTVAYDHEPNRNVVATADRLKAEVPSKLLSQVMGVTKANGVRAKVLAPPSYKGGNWMKSQDASDHW